MNKLKIVKRVALGLAGLIIAKTVLNNKSELKREIRSINNSSTSLFDYFTGYLGFSILFGERMIDETRETVDDTSSKISDVGSSIIDTTSNISYCGGSSSFSDSSSSCSGGGD